MKQVRRIINLQKKQKVYIGVGFVLSQLAILIQFTPVRVALISLIGLGVAMIIYLEKRIKKIKSKEEERQINDLREKCLEKIADIETLFVANGYSTDVKENYILADIYQTLNQSCVDVRSYKNFLRELDLRLEYILDSMDMRKRWKNEAKFKESFKQKAEVYVNINYVAKYLRVLGLPDDTTNFEVVKKAYRRLIKSYHPDKFALASEEEKMKATELSMGINEAYEELEKVLKVS